MLFFKMTDKMETQGSEKEFKALEKYLLPLT